MSRNIDREEAFRLAAEKVRLKKEKEAQADKEFYERITSGFQWLLFKIVMVLCTIMVVITSIEVLVDGPTEKLSEQDWKIDRDWEYTWHKVLDVKGYMFTPTLKDWSDRKENDLKMVYSPIFHTGKKLTYKRKTSEASYTDHEELRQHSLFNWFPEFQILLLIPLLTFVFRRQSAWFNFARIASFIVVFPGMLLVILYSLM